jgi:lipopolysaccharide biosynthesis glycosyltransferase
MTSSDDNLARYILPQLVSINRNLSEYDVHFFLAHNRISSQNLQLLKDFAKSETDISFHEARVEKSLSLYESLVNDGGGQWPQEAYFTLRLQEYLPEEVDRILYIDAGDVIIDGDIAPYYFGDFEGNSIIATPLGFKQNPVTKETELYTTEDILSLSAGSLFNSGSYVINVEKFRNEGYSEDDYRFLHSMLKQHAKPGQCSFFGDQGFLAAAFVGDVKFFGYPEHKDPAYMPYNFRSSYWGLFKNEPDYTPVILHYAIMSKPWIVRFDEEVIEQSISNPQFISKQLVVPIPPIAYMTHQHLHLGETWWKYARETPVYEEMDMVARAVAKSWVKCYLPLCVQYNELYYKAVMMK